jgi:hypothetical protein
MLAWEVGSHGDKVEEEVDVGQGIRYGCPSGLALLEIP